MAVEEIVLQKPRESTRISQRWLGIMGMIGAPMMLVDMLLRSIVYRPDAYNNRLVGALGAIYMSGALASTIGMRRRRVTGNGPWSRALYIVQMTGLTLALIWTVQEATGLAFSPHHPLFRLGDAAWPLSHLLMLVVGGFVWRAGVWRGPVRIAPFLCGLALPAAFATFAVAGMTGGGLTFGLLTATGFMWLGHAVRTGEATASEKRQ